jgi:hypothetical protein
MIFSVENNPKVNKELTEKTIELMELKKALSRAQKDILLYIKLLPSLWIIKLKNEYYYRKYGNSESFRSVVETAIMEAYEKIKEKHLQVDEKGSEELFIHIISNFALTKKVKQMLKEDAQEALETIKVREKLNEHKDEILEALKALN